MLDKVQNKISVNVSTNCGEKMEKKVKGIFQNKRNSSIELLKIIAMFMIVINHVTRSLQPPQFYSDAGYSILLSSTPQNIQEFILGLFCYFGPIGNSIFLISSVWFLLDDNAIKKDKVKRLIIDTWVISVVLCAVFSVFGPAIVPKSYILRSFFPIIFSNNWYVTCYLLIYLVHPVLNVVVEKLEKKAFFTLTSGLFVAYFIIAFISENFLFYSNLIFFLSSYLIVGYIKKYFNKYVSNVKWNQRITLFSICICILMHFVTMLFSKHNSALSNRMLVWTSNNNPFTFFMAFSVFNIVRTMEWKSGLINSISSLTLLIYIIHENLYVKSILRPFIWEKVYLSFGHSQLILIDILYSILLFVGACMLAMAFKWINRKLVYKALSPVIDCGMNIITNAFNNL